METLLTRVEHNLIAQRSLVTRDQLRAAGLTDKQIEGLRDRRVLTSVRRGVYQLFGVSDEWERGLLAAILTLKEPSFGSKSSSARLWRYAVLPDCSRYDVLIFGEQRPSLRGVRIHRTTQLEPADIATISGIPCTSFERTLCDCTTILSEFQLSRVLDDGLRRGVASLPSLRDCAERLESGPGRHMSVIRNLLAARDANYNPGGSRQELNVLDVIRSANLPEPVQQFEVKVGGKTFYLDYAYPDWKVLIEWYGLAWHIGASNVAHDNDRLTDLAGVGWLPVIFSDGATRSRMVDRITAALRQRGAVW
jgi:hypothetical protein